MFDYPTRRICRQFLTGGTKGEWSPRPGVAWGQETLDYLHKAG